jgi:hypothetical protein
MTTYTPNQIIKEIGDITIICYTNKSLIITGDTKSHKDYIKQGNINGRWNPHLRQPYFKGWVIPLSKLEYVLEYFDNLDRGIKPTILSNKEKERIRRNNKRIEDPNYTMKQSIKRRERRYTKKNPEQKRSSKYKTTNLDINSIIKNESFVKIIKRNYKYSIRLDKYTYEIRDKIYSFIDEFKVHKDFERFKDDINNLCEFYYSIIVKFKDNKKRMLYYRLKLILSNFGKVVDKIKTQYNCVDIRPDLPTDKISCKCSNRLFMRKNLNKHNLSKKHIQWLEDFGKE